jgi:small-conductance mechanosensitive channel
MSASALTFDPHVFVGDVETSVRAKSDLNFEIFRRFKEEKFFDAPAPGTTKVEIVSFENLGSSAKPFDEISTANQPKRAPGR